MYADDNDIFMAILKSETDSKWLFGNHLNTPVKVLASK